jgi:hypothetical protein
VEDYEVLVTDPLPEVRADFQQKDLATILSPSFATFEHPLTRFSTNARSRIRGR